MMQVHRCTVWSTFLPLYSLDINRQSVQYNIYQSMDNIESWKNLFQQLTLQHFYSQGHCVVSYLHPAPFSLPFGFSYAQEHSKQFLQAQKTVGFSSNGISLVWTKRKLVTQHLAWMKHSIPKTVNRLLWTAIIGGNYSSFQFDESSQEDSLLDYLRQGKSLIPTEMIQNFKKCLALQLGLKKILQWVYGHVQPMFGDQLILIAYKVLVVYLNFKQNGLNYNQICSILNLPFNIFDILQDPSLRILNFSSFCKKINGSDQLDSDLYRFCLAYIDTILLVLEGKYQNPYFKQIQVHEEGRQKCSISEPWKKKKKIAKRK